MLSSAQSMLLAAAINSREFCEQIEDVSLTDEGAGILRAVRTLYDGDANAVALERASVETIIRAQCHDDKVADVRCEYLQALPEQCDSTAKTLLHAIRLKARRLALIDALLRDIPPIDLSEQLEEYALMSADGEREEAVSLESLLINTADKIQVNPAELNDALNGGMRPGQTLLIAGRPGAAKTLLCVEIVAGFAKRGKKCLYIGNEEGGEILLLRFISRMGGVDLKDLDSPDRARAEHCIRSGHALALKHGLGNICIVSGVTNFGTVAKLVKEGDYDVVVLDQLRHMNTGDGDGMTQQMESSMRALRNLCTKRSLIGIAVAQAGQSAEQKLVLGMGDLDGSKTGTQGAVDVIVMIGVTVEWQQLNKRMINICRNKVSGIITNFAIYVNEQRTKVMPKG